MSKSYQSFIMRQLDALLNETSPDDVRLCQVQLQGYIRALSDADVIDAAEKRQHEGLLDSRVDQRLAELEAPSGHSGRTTSAPTSPSPAGASPANRVSYHPTERDRPGLMMARAALARREGQYGDAYSICDLLLEQIDLPGGAKEPSYDDLLASAAQRDQA
ncbi:TPA: hypothetical protein ACLEB8_004827 [Pseudomonas aeruginosa]